MNFKDSINSALAFSLKKDKNMICYGLGINDPKKNRFIPVPVAARIPIKFKYLPSFV